MHLTERILGFTLLGSEWVLWLLIGLSVLSVAIMVERGRGHSHPSVGQPRGLTHMVELHDPGNAWGIKTSTQRSHAGQFSQ